MALINALVSLVLKVLHNFVFVQSLCWQINTDVSKILKNILDDIAFILNVLSEIVSVFA